MRQSGKTEAIAVTSNAVWEVQGGHAYSVGSGSVLVGKQKEKQLSLDAWRNILSRDKSPEKGH